MKNSMKLAGVITAATIVLALGTTSVYAHGWGGTNSTSLIQKLVEKFGLKTADVQTVFDSVRQDRQAEMQKAMAERLDTFVSEGKITAEQKKLILAKHQQMQQERVAEIESMKDLTPEERRTKMETNRGELEAWAKENGIDLQYALGFGRGMGKAMGRGIGLNQ